MNQNSKNLLKLISYMAPALKKEQIAELGFHNSVGPICLLDKTITLSTDRVNIMNLKYFITLK